MTDRIGALAFAALLGMPPLESDLAALDVPTGTDPQTYRAHIRERLTGAADALANGDAVTARTAADEVLNGHRLAIAVSPPPDPRSRFAEALRAQQESHQ